MINPFTSKFPKCRRPCIWIGAVLCWISLFGASYATTVNQLIALLGLLYAIGGGMLAFSNMLFILGLNSELKALVYLPCLSFLPEWFVQRRGLANGVIFAGTLSYCKRASVSISHIMYS